MNNMVNNQTTLSSFERLKQWPGARYLDNYFLLVESPGKAPFPHNAREMTFILVALCTGGEASYTIDTQEYRVKAGEAVIIGDGHLVDHFAPVGDLDGMCMVLSSEFFSEIICNVSDFSELLLFSRLHPVVRLSEREVEVFKSYFHLLSEKLDDVHNHYRRDVVRTLILALFYDMGSVIYKSVEQQGMRRPRSQQIFTEFIRLVEAHHRHERKVSWYAHQLCLSPKYLSETVKSVSKQSPNEWIERYVVLTIRLMLLRTDKSIKEIADELMFPNQSFLGRYFRTHTGMSPSKFRNS